MPSQAPSLPSFRSVSSLTPVVCDERAIGRLLEQLIYKSGLNVNQAAKLMGVTSNTIRQYIAGRRSRPSLIWFVKLATACGATVQVEFKR